MKVRVCIQLGGPLSSTTVIHVLRPYASEEEYLAHEHSSIDSKTMLLIDQPPLPLDTAVVFDIQLANGQKPIRAEAKVVGHVAAGGTEPSGLRVRFKRFGAATKAFIDRAVALSVAARGSLPSLPEAPASHAAPSLVPRVTRDPDLATTPAVISVKPRATPEPREPSGIHRRPVAPVAAPANREELLERLRARGRNAARASAANPGEQTG
ncbi:MAG TPA: hypothetical protein VHV51_10745 [Polyangiaceae bacterium]|nr:hypothetical protein [Polyangiaceae bacterium]